MSAGVGCAAASLSPMLRVVCRSVRAVAAEAVTAVVPQPDSAVTITKMAINRVMIIAFFLVAVFMVITFLYMSFSSELRRIMRPRAL